MFELVEYLPEHAIEVITAGAKEPGLVLNELTEGWARVMGEKGPAVTGMFDGRPVSCGGIWLCWPGVGEHWMANRFDIGKYHIDPQHAKKWMYEKIDEYKIWRLQTPLRSDFPVGERYAKWLGGKYEARLENYHTDGTDALMYTIITKKYLPKKGILP